MLVYRVCKKEEIMKILEQESLNGVARRYKRNPAFNNHQYDPNKKYLHFFKDYDSLFYYSIANGNFICTYDIDEDILEESKGLGFYYDRFRMEKLEAVEEYAVDVSKIDFGNIKRIDQGTRYIDYEEYVLNDYKDGLKIYYKKKNPFIRKIENKLRNKKK